MYCMYCVHYNMVCIYEFTVYLLHVLWLYSSNHPNTVISWKSNTSPIPFDVSNNRHVKRVRRAVSGASKNQSVYLLTIRDFQGDKFAGIYSCKDKGGYMTRHFEFKCLGEYSTASQCVQTCVLYVRTVCMYKRVSCMYSMYVQTCVMYVCTVCRYKPVSCTYVLYCKMYVRMYVCMQQGVLYHVCVVDSAMNINTIQTNNIRTYAHTYVRSFILA